MELRLKRMYFGETYTSGCLQYRLNRTDEFTYLCDTLEPKAINWEKQKKIKRITAIPEGEYKVEMRYSSRFKKCMPYLVGVPEFEGVMFHPGNYPRDTYGCILLGKDYSHDGVLAQSRFYFESFMNVIENCLKKDKRIYLEVRSPKGWRYK